MGVAIAAGSIPETGALTFELGPDEIEIGMGAHGEPGVSRQKLTTADAITEQMMAAILSDLPFRSGDEVALLINNLGATTMMELLVVNRRVRQILAECGLSSKRDPVAMSRNPLRLRRNLTSLSGSLFDAIGDPFLSCLSVTNWDTLSITDARGPVRCTFTSSGRGRPSRSRRRPR